MVDQQTGDVVDLSLQHVTKLFGDVVAVDDFSLDVRHGEFVALIGPSGCGKTTCLRTIAGLEKPTAGRIFLKGRDVSALAVHQRGTFMVWQTFNLFPHLNVRKNIEFGLTLKKIDPAVRERKVKEVSEPLGIEWLLDRKITQLSGGQMQRVAIARALVNDPVILLLDEPLASLDAKLRVKMQGELKAIQKMLDISFVYVTHNQSEAFAMADRVVVMNDGRIEQIGSPSEVYSHPRTQFVAEFVGMNNLFPGKVVGLDGEGATVETPYGTFHVVVRDERPSVGEPVILVVRADLMVTDREEEKHANQISAVLRGQEYVGSLVTFFLEMTDGREIKVSKHESFSTRIGRHFNEAMGISWRPEDTVILTTE